MRTHIEFASGAFPAYPSEEEEINPGRHGKRLAEFLVAELPAAGFDVSGINAEDWGWRIDLVNVAFPLWIGCGNYEEFENGFLCFIEPSKPSIRRWLSKVSTVETVERLTGALQGVLEKSGKVSRLRWWGDNET